MTPNSECPIWGVDCIVRPFDVDTDPHFVENSFRAGGDYEIFSNARAAIRKLDSSERARLTSFLVEQRMRGITAPRITQDEALRAKKRSPLPAHERAERLLRLLANQSSRIDEALEIFHLSLSPGVASDDFDVTQLAMAWSESTTDEELDFLTDYLAGQGWIKKEDERIKDIKVGLVALTSELYSFRVEVPGYSRIEEIITNPDSSQCFVAMWFDDSMNEVYEKGFIPAIEAAGYTPLRIDKDPGVIGKIDDAIIAAIRRSRFVVADFTHGDSGARGSVYYEAGFAHGLSLPVIFTCHKDMMGKVHFDVNHFNHILWEPENPEELREQLTDRIVAAIGQGPNRNG